MANLSVEDYLILVESRLRFAFSFVTFVLRYWKDGLLT